MKIKYLYYLVPAVILIFSYSKILKNRQKALDVEDKIHASSPKSSSQKKILKGNVDDESSDEDSTSSDDNIEK